MIDCQFRWDDQSAKAGRVVWQQDLHGLDGGWWVAGYILRQEAEIRVVGEHKSAWEEMQEDASRGYIKESLRVGWLVHCAYMDDRVAEGRV